MKREPTPGSAFFVLPIGPGVWVVGNMIVYFRQKRAGRPLLIDQVCGVSLYDPFLTKPSAFLS